MGKVLSKVIDICVGQTVHLIKEIINGIEWTVNKINDIFKIKAEISCPRLMYQIKDFLKKDVKKYKHYKIRSGNNKLIYELANGTYHVEQCIGTDKILLKLTVKLTSTCAILTTWQSKKLLNTFINTMSKPIESKIPIYTNNKDEWSKPTFRKPRDVKKTLELYPSIKNVINDIDSTFIKKIYEKKGHPYRRGYMITGAPGTGKSSTAEVIASNYDMLMYIIILNSKEMSDSVLLNLIQEIPPHSVIVFDEMDKQLDTIRKKENSMISNAGILQSLDGPGTRLSEGSIVIMTANNTEFITEDFARPLMRPGRIDRHFEF